MKFKKKKGMIDKVGIPMVTIFFLSVFVLMCVNFTSDIDKKESVDILARKYLLKMEAEGYLTPTREIELKNKLQQLGVQNVSLVGTTLTSVGYGKDVRIKITGALPTKMLNINSTMDKQESTVNVPINIDYSSTAKN